MRRVLSVLIVLAIAAIGCERYEANDLQLLTVYSAKQLCSCVFVMKRSDDFCDAWAKEDPNVKTATIDRKNERVETQALGMWGARARFVDAHRGCVVE
jgi:hypothetical protein